MANLKAVQHQDWKLTVATKQRQDNMKDISVHHFRRQAKSRVKKLSGPQTLGWTGKGELKTNLFLTSVASRRW